MQLSTYVMNQPMGWWESDLVAHPKEMRLYNNYKRKKITMHARLTICYEPATWDHDERRIWVLIQWRWDYITVVKGRKSQRFTFQKLSKKETLLSLPPSSSDCIPFFMDLLLQLPAPETETILSMWVSLSIYISHKPPFSILPTAMPKPLDHLIPKP